MVHATREEYNLEARVAGLDLTSVEQNFVDADNLCVMNWEASSFFPAAVINLR